jgi:HAD superfamily hydrolase (TIGR01509 family)
VEIIKSLRASYKLALLSNSPSALIREILAEHDLAQYFDEIIVSSEVGFIKPSADIFTLALQKLGVSADQALFIDDNERHIQAARSLGIQSIQFTSAQELTTALATIGVTVTADAK